MRPDSSRSVIVTGAAGDIGAAAARRFAARQCSVALFDRKRGLLDAIGDECRALGAPVLQLGVDQTDPDAVADGVAAVVEAHGRVDVLFANAGYGKFSTFLEQPLNEWRRHVDVNLTGTFLVCQAAAQTMAAAGSGGAIVVNASSGAIQHTNLLSAYCSTKAALAMLVKGMAAELGGHRIRVNAVLPGVIETGMTAPMLGADDGQREHLLRSTPLGRLGAPDDVAEMACFLASDAAGFVTGQCVAVDGGQTVLGEPQWYQTDFRDSHRSEWRAAR